MSRKHTLRQLPTAPRRARGVSLIEVLVSVLVLAVGLLGIAAMQATALRNSQGAFEQSQAVTLTYSMLDMMRTNADVATIGGYNLASFTCDAPAGDSRVGREQALWIGQLKATLGDTACGRIVCRSEDCTVEVRWRPHGSREADPQTVTTVTRL